jgi:hypothetical protein
MDARLTAGLCNFPAPLPSEEQERCPIMTKKNYQNKSGFLE